MLDHIVATHYSPPNSGMFTTASPPTFSAAFFHRSSDALFKAMKLSADAEMGQPDKGQTYKSYKRHSRRRNNTTSSFESSDASHKLTHNGFTPSKGLKSSASLPDLKAICGQSEDEEDESTNSDTELSKKAKEVHVPTRRVSILSTQQIDPSALQQLQKKAKKSVSFADEKGLKLTKIKVMTESSDTPPFLKRHVLSMYSNDPLEAAAVSNSLPRWKTEFAQPASQYITFRDKLESVCVSLENIIIANDDGKDTSPNDPASKKKNANVSGHLSGTIKVKNIAMEKTVFLKVTFDHWTTNQDIYATYLPDTEAYTRFDTFTFEFTIPKLSNASGKKLVDAVEFCVCYRSGSTEFWDNNCGKNYKLTLDKSLIASSSSEPMYTSDFRPNYNMYDTLTTFRAWKHYSAETIYY